MKLASLGVNSHTGNRLVTLNLHLLSYLCDKGLKGRWKRRQPLLIPLMRSGGIRERSQQAKLDTLQGYPQQWSREVTRNQPPSALIIWGS